MFNQWNFNLQASEKKDAYNISKYTTCMDSGANGVKFEEACPGQKSEHYVCSFPAERNDNKNLHFHGSSFPDGAAIGGNNNKRRWILEGGEHHPLAKRALLRKVDTLPFANDLVGKNCLQSSSPLLPIIEESIECSVASCSGDNLPGYTVGDTRNENYSREISGSLFDDTSSSFAPKSWGGRPDVSEDDLAANVHELELHAYKSTVQALYASGPLSWEQESLLTNLRMSLHISNEEHLLQLRNLLSD